MAGLLSAVEPYEGVALALVLGLLMGIERGWSHRNEPTGSRVAGFRTFGLLGLTGGLAGVLSGVSVALGILLIAAAAITLLVGYGRQATEGDVSATTTIAGVITLAVGVMAATEQAVLASSVAAVTTLLLAQRRQLHDWIGRLSEAELHSIARFGLIALAILPLLPNREFGPYNAWNPRALWMVVVLVSGLSLAGYAAGKVLGASKGVLATAAAGALVSSTAVTAAMAARLRQGEERQESLIAAIALASVVMFLRVMALVAVLAPFALFATAVVAVPGALASAIFIPWLLRKDGQGAGAAAPGVKNPFDIGPALFLAGLVMLMTLSGRWAMEAFGHAGLAVVLGISGLLDVDAAIITMGSLPADSLTPRTAGLVLAAPVLANTLVKAGVALTVAKGKAGRMAAAPLAASVVASLAGVAALLTLFPE